jgi:hypothetical protein
MRYDHLNELVNHLIFLSMIDADFSDEFGATAASSYADAWETLDFFITQTPSESGKKRLRKCIRTLRRAFEHLQQGECAMGQKLVIETEEMLKRGREDIQIS